MYTFYVLPGMRPFHTSDVIDTATDASHGDTNDAFFNAHLLAATIAANNGHPSFVVEQGDFTKKRGFGSDAINYPNSVYGRILRRNIAAYFDFRDKVWKSHELHDEVSRRSVVLLTHHKQESV
jgi:hypothetical protein